MKKAFLIAFLGVVLCLTMATPGYASDVQGTYVDVFDTDWFVNDVGYVYNGKLMDGTGNTFSPTANTTRGELIEAMYRMDGSPDVAITDEFTDLSASSPYAASVSWAAENGIVNGYDNGKMGVGDQITREQMVTILYRYAEAKGMDLSNKADLSSYADANTISKWAQDAFSWANKAGLINGTSTTTLSPKGTTTRAQVAAVVHRYGEGIYGKTYTGDFVASHRDKQVIYLLVKEIGKNDMTTYDYDTKGNYLGKTWLYNNGAILATCTYDKEGKIIESKRYGVKNYSYKTPIDCELEIREEKSFAYDNKGQFISEKDYVYYDGVKQEWDSATFAPTYDKLGRITSGGYVKQSESGAGALDVTYSYTEDGYSMFHISPRRENYNTEWSMLYRYDTQGRLIYTEDRSSINGDETLVIFEYTYNANNQIIKEHEYINDTMDLVREYLYNEFGDISEIWIHGNRYGDVDQHIMYINTYDEHGNLISQDQTGYDSFPGYHRPKSFEYIAIE